MITGSIASKVAGVPSPTPRTAPRPTKAIAAEPRGRSTSQERSTRQKRAVAAALEGSDQFRSAQDLYAELRSRGENVGLTTIYSQLRALADTGEVDSLQTASGETLYRRCSTDSHHHHLVCRQCGATVEIEGPAVERWADQVATQHGYVDISHTIEILGICGHCASQ
jgi:Fur family transcriptional regulator, ferric uptake regulator